LLTFDKPSSWKFDWSYGISLCGIIFSFGGKENKIMHLMHMIESNQKWKGWKIIPHGQKHNVWLGHLLNIHSRGRNLYKVKGAHIVLKLVP
jgi:hypothetical protein